MNKGTNSQTATQQRKTAEIIVVANEKGGVGKTTSCHHIAACLKAMGYRVLLVDGDPSGNLSCATLTEIPELVLYDVLRKRCSIMDAIYETPIADILPTIKDVPGEDGGFSVERKTLTTIISEMNSSKVGSYYMGQLLRNSPIMEKYDFVICDSSPADTILVTNLLLCANSIIIPCELSSASANGFYMMLASVNEAKDLRHTMAAKLKDPSSYNLELNIDGIVFANYSMTYKTDKKEYEGLVELVKELGIPAYSTKIRHSGNLKDCLNENRPITDYTNSGTGYADCMNFALEFLAKRKLAPRVMVPGIIKDENNSYIFCDKNTRFYTYEVVGDCVKIHTHSFSKSLLDNEDFMGQIGETVFFSYDTLSDFLRYIGLNIVDVLPEGDASEVKDGANDGT